MALNSTKLAAKRLKKAQRRKQVAALHQREDALLARGDMRPLAARHRRRLSDNRKHHRTSIIVTRSN